MRLEGKKAIITGAASGIGREIAKMLAREGADIVIADVQVEAARKVAAEIKEIGRQAIVVKTDVTNANDVDEMVKASLETFGRIDILVNDAGVNVLKLIQDMEEEDWDKVLNVNLKGTFLCTRRVVQEMLKSGKGKIINIASGLAKAALPKYCAYIASKSGVIGLTQELGLELAPKGINVNAVAPGMTETPFNRDRLKDEEFRKRMIDRTPIGRLGRPEDIAHAVVYLASDESDNVVGETIFVDGGSNIAASYWKPS